MSPTRCTAQASPTFLLLPTWSIIHSRQWKAQIPFLAREHRVVTFDGRGNGRSDRPTSSEAYDEREFALDALAVLDATGTDRAVIVGYSLGAPRGLILAVERPERVAGAVFIGPAYSGGGEPLPERVMPWEDELDTDEGWAKYIRHYWLRDYQGFLDFFFGKLFREPHSTKQIEDCVGWGLETTPETLIAAHYGAKPDPTRLVRSRSACAVPSSSSTAPATRSPRTLAGVRSPSTRAANSSCSKAEGTLRTGGTPSSSTSSCATSPGGSNDRRPERAGAVARPLPR